MNYLELAYWNTRTYGRALHIKKPTLVALLLAIAISIPIVAPVWAVPIAAKMIPNAGLTIR